MKRFLRLFCTGLAAMTITSGFAQGENVTSKLRNADFEERVKGWGIEALQHLWSPERKSQQSRPGFHGFNNYTLQNWTGSANVLSDNSVYQQVTGLKSGTYVFGAYIGASKQVPDVPKGSELPNREEVLGVTLFANEQTVPVATEDPELVDVKWAHTAKFNVATTVTDGTLKVGIKVAETTANWVIWDNATLYYFGDMSPEEALNEMAKIDMQATIAIVDTCLVHKMNADTLALVKEAKAMGEAVANADDAYLADEEMYWAIMKANRSIADYRAYGEALDHARAIAAREWTNWVNETNALPNLVAGIAEAEAIYETATLTRDALALMQEELNELAAMVELDSLLTILDDVLVPFYEGLDVGDELGQYAEEQQQSLIDLEQEAREVFDEVVSGDVLPSEAAAYIQRIWDAIENVKNNPNSVDSFPFQVGEADGTVANIVDGQFHFTSRTYSFSYPVKVLRFAFDDSFVQPGNGDPRADTNGNPCVAIAEFYLYDGDGFQIELTAENYSTNAQEPNEGPITNICDGNLGTFWHSMWSTGINEQHYLEVTLPDGLDLSSFSFGWVTRFTGFVVPHEVTVSSMSNVEADLQNIINAAKGMNTAQGAEPGFLNADLAPFYAAIAAAEALVGTDASDGDKAAAIAAVQAEIDRVGELSVELPVAGKSYRIVSGHNGFFSKQGVQKALYANGDTLFWQTASAESQLQDFVFQPIENADGEALFTVQNVATGLYLNHMVDVVYVSPDKEETAAKVPLTDKPDTIRLVSLGAGVFQLQDMAGNTFHAVRHNGGTLTTDSAEVKYGGMIGDWSCIIPWNEGIGSGSAWYIREMHALPHTLAAEAGAFKSAPLHLYSGVNTIQLTADKACAFADLVIYDLWGEPIEATVNVSDATATIMLDSNIESFSVAFTNNEGVASVVITGSISTLSVLQEAYDEAVAIAPEKGTGVMQYADLTDYEAALAFAEKLLTSGGTDEQVEDAIHQLEGAVEGLKPNMPEAGKTYFIVSAYEKFRDNHGVQMMMYVNGEGTLRWLYENIYNPASFWMFEEATVEEGAPAAYYVKNAATGQYLSLASGSGAQVIMVDAQEQTVPYTITSLKGSIVAIAANTNAGYRLHCESHGSGGGRQGNIVYWNDGANSASAWRIIESESYIFEETGIEAIEADDAEQNLRPVVKGVYDLFGRKVVNPTKGIYIINGTKQVVK